MKRLKELRELCADKKAELKALHTTLETENRAMTEQEIALVEAIETALAAFKKEIGALETMDEENKEEAVRSASIGSVSTSSNESKEIEKNFSMIRFMNQAISGKLEGFEKEMHQEAEKELRASGLSSESGGFGIPTIVMQNMNAKFNRAQSAGTDSEGGYTIQTDKGDLIEPFAPAPIVSRMGATVLPNLVGDLSLPKDTNLFSMTWEGENDDSAETSKVFSEVLLSPKRMAGYADLSRTLLRQASFDIQNYVNNQFIVAVNSTLDAAAINGSGTGGQPTGILNTAGIGDVVGGTNGAVPTWGNIVDLESEVNIDDALEGNLGYLTTAGIKGALKQTLKASGVSGYIWDGETMNGYNAMTSSNVPSNLTKGTSSDANAIVFGNFADLVVGQFGGVFILPDPYTQAGKSRVRMHTELFCDIAVKRAKSFAAMKDALTA